MVHEPRPPQRALPVRPAAAAPAPTPSTAELKPGHKREEVEGVFLIKDDKATFVKVKLGIAGERYLEVLTGLKEGDQVITGPFDSVRGMYDGDSCAPRRGRRDAARSRSKPEHTCRSSSNRSVLALASIWANKLRSLLTLLGNIVAVSSIITVVALITGVNAAVTDAIVSDLGADSFTVQRMGITQNEDDFERMRNNPLVTLEGRAAR